MNINMKMTFTIALLMTLLLSACGLNVVRGSGRIVTEPRPVSGFTSVNFSGFGELTLVHGDTESLTIETDDNLLPYIKTRVSQGTLTIGFDDDRLFPVIRPTRSIRYTLTVKTLSALDLSGAGMVEVDGLTADALTLRESGAGAIKIAELAASDVMVEMSGAGSIQLAGQVEHQTVEMSGLGTYDAGDLASQSAEIKLSGAGTATLWVNEMLDSELSGLGTINYYGSPQTKASASGVGTLQHLGNKK